MPPIPLVVRVAVRAVIDATKIIEDYRRFFASFWPGIFRISAKNLPLWSLRPSLTVGMTKIPKVPGFFLLLFCWNLRNIPTEPSSEMLASFTAPASSVTSKRHAPAFSVIQKDGRDASSHPLLLSSYSTCGIEPAATRVAADSRDAAGVPERVGELAAAASVVRELPRDVGALLLRNKPVVDRQQARQHKSVITTVTLDYA